MSKPSQEKTAQVNLSKLSIEPTEEQNKSQNVLSDHASTKGCATDHPSTAVATEPVKDSSTQKVHFAPDAHKFLYEHNARTKKLNEEIKKRKEEREAWEQNTRERLEWMIEVVSELQANAKQMKLERERDMEFLARERVRAMYEVAKDCQMPADKKANIDHVAAKLGLDRDRVSEDDSLALTDVEKKEH